MYGVTHVMAVDGFSCKIVGTYQCLFKYPIMIYDILMKPLLSTGLWQQVRVDHGMEFILVQLFNIIFCELSTMAGSPTCIAKYITLKSQSGAHVARNRPGVNYPVKRVLVEMESMLR